MEINSPKKISCLYFQSKFQVKVSSCVENTCLKSAGEQQSNTYLFSNKSLFKGEYSQGLFYKLRAAFGIYKKGTPNLTSPYVYSLFTFVLIKQIFLKNMSLRAASGIRTQFWHKKPLDSVN